jgi:hypothetical protein
MASARGLCGPKNGHLVKNDRTASRFSSLFADFGYYDIFTAPGGSQHGTCHAWPSLMPPAIDTGRSAIFSNHYFICKQCKQIIGRQCKIIYYTFSFIRPSDVEPLAFDEKSRFDTSALFMRRCIRIQLYKHAYKERLSCFTKFSIHCTRASTHKENKKNQKWIFHRKLN